jgi:putative methyltransferase (TIGR01177 family)
LSGSLFVLSGEEYTFPSAEIRALVETYSLDSKCKNLGPRIIESDLVDEPLVSRVAQRAAYCRFGGQIIATGNSAEELAKEIQRDAIEQGKTFVVDSETLDRLPCADLGGLIKEKTGASVSLENPDLVFQLETTGENLVLGLSRSGFKSFTWRLRRPRARRFFLPSAIFPKLACLLVNLSHAKEGELFLDPFCGTGSLIIESCMMGIDAIGIDLTRWIARGAQMNLNGFFLKNGAVLRADSTGMHLPLKPVGAIATDVPYGRASSTKGKDTETILKEFSHAAGEILEASEGKRPKYCLLMHPASIEFDFDKSAFVLVEEHLLYVHRNLTRAISVLKRKGV